VLASAGPAIEVPDGDGAQTQDPQEPAVDASTWRELLDVGLRQWNGYLAGELALPDDGNARAARWSIPDTDRKAMVTMAAPVCEKHFGDDMTIEAALAVTVLAWALPRVIAELGQWRRERRELHAIS